MKKRRTHRTSRSLLRRLYDSIVSKVDAHALWTGALLLFGAYVLFFYIYFISPYTSSWRGIYDDARYPSGFTIRGIDVSHHQGKINWSDVRHAEIGNEPVSFVFIKATEGADLIDEAFDRNFREAQTNGLIRGAYHYFQPGTSAHAQADHFIRRVKLEVGDLPPVLDLETTGKLSAPALRDSALVWLRLMERHYGVKPILYTYHNFKTEFLNTPAFDDYPYWIAHYYVDTLRYEGKWKFWQHTDRGKIDGIKGYVDINCYNGSMYDLQQLTIAEHTDDD